MVVAVESDPDAGPVHCRRSQGIVCGASAWVGDTPTEEHCSLTHSNQLLESNVRRTSPR